MIHSKLPDCCTPWGINHNQTKVKMKHCRKRAPHERRYLDITLHLLFAVHITMQQPLLCWGA